MDHQLDPDAQAVVDAMRAANLPPISTISVAEARERMRLALVSRKAPLPVARVDERAVPTPNGPLALRTYRPIAGRLPVALFLHGGGWMLNDLDTHDDLCRRLAKRSGWLIASLAFRRAPEHRYPASLEDAQLAYRWLIDNAGKIGGEEACPALIGESSGGTIAASLSLLLRDFGAPMPSYQVLAYPATDHPDRWPSYAERGSGYILDRETMAWYFEHYLPTSWSPTDPHLFPLAAENLSGLPPTFLLTAEFDPLRDEGIAYARKLAAAGVAVEHVHADDQMHGFLLLGSVVSKAAEMVDRLATRLANIRRPASTVASCEPGFYVGEDGDVHILC
jgi:acetyl esterase